MAPNNALAELKRSRKLRKSATPAKTTPPPGATTVLDAGTVEDRGAGISVGDASGAANEAEVVAREIASFLRSDARLGLRSEIRAFFTVWTFITRLPGPTWVDHHPGFLMLGTAYFPLAGALVGAWVAAFFDAAVAIGLPLPVSAAFSTAASFWLTGCFHEDGLADATDGIGGGWSRKQILRIMTDTRLGTYGCASLTTYVIAKVALLAACGASSYGYEYDGGSSNPLSGSLSLTGAGPALVLGHALARWTAPYLIRTRAYVDEGGPKYKYYSFMLRARSLVGWARVAVAGATALAVAAAVVGVQTACVLFLVVWTFAEAAGRYGEYLLGGVMGDYLGATICIAELLVLAMVVMVQNAQNAGVYASIVKAGGILKSFAEERAAAAAAAAAAPKKGLSRLFNLFASKPPPRVAAATARAFLRETFVDGDSGARWAAIARFVALLLATYAWCKRVGHPDVFVRANAVAAADAAEEEEEEEDDLDKETALTESEDERDEFLRGRSRTVRAAVAAAAPAASSATPSPSRSSFGAGAFDDATRQSLAGPFAALELHTPPVRRGVAAALAAAAEHANANANANATRVTTETQTLNERESAEVACASPVASFEKRAAAARAYLDALAKPVGSLGTIEAWASRLAALQRTMNVKVDAIACLIFAADNGTAASRQEGGESCSAYPRSVTRSVLEGIEKGVAGACVIARCNGVSLRVVDVGVAGANFPRDGRVVRVSSRKLIGGTACFTRRPAMHSETADRLVRVGRDAFIQYVLTETNADAVCLGEVGIGNTTAASALICALTGASPHDVCRGGARAGRDLDEDAVRNKIDVVERALRLHAASMRTAGAALAKLGGAEIAALVGAILEASERDVPVLVDGFVVTAAALVAAAISPAACRVMFFASKSGDETGQGAAMAKVRAIARENGIDIQEGPALSMGLRMGEGSGAMLAAPILRSAAEVLNRMGTIKELLSSDAGGGGGGTPRESERTPTSSSNMTTQTPTRGKRSKSFLASLDDTTSSSDGEEEEEEDDDDDDDDRGLASEKSVEYEQVMRALSP